MSITHTITKGLASSNASPLSGSYYQVGSSEQSVDVLLAAGSADVSQAASFGPGGTAAGDLLSIAIEATVDMTLKTNGTATADVQTISISGTPTGGSFSLAFDGQSTILAYNATAAAVQSALRSLATIGGSNVTCTGGPLPGTPVVCTFAGSKATGRQSLMTAYSGALTGGTSPTASVAHTTPGMPQETIALTAGHTLAWDASMSAPCPFAAAVTGFYLTSSVAGRFQARILVA